MLAWPLVHSYLKTISLAFYQVSPGFQVTEVLMMFGDIRSDSIWLHFMVHTFPMWPRLWKKLKVAVNIPVDYVGCCIANSAAPFYLTLSK